MAGSGILGPHRSRSNEARTSMDVRVAREPTEHGDPLEREPARDLGPHLAWLTSVLWPAADVRLSPTRVPPGHRVAEAYRVLPNAAHARLLVPFSSPELVEGAIRRLDRGTTRLSRAALAVRSRLAASSVGWARFPPFVVSFDREPRPDELLTQHLRGVVDRPDPTLAISFGTPTADRKPVVQVLTLEGDVLGFGKVGWNDPTRALLSNEASALRRWARSRPRSFAVPELLHDGSWKEHALTVLSPVPAEGGPAVAVARMPSIDATREIARSGGIALAPLASTPWWRSIIARAGSADHALAVVLRWMQDVHGRRLVWLGSWHGDWTPRNMGRVAGVLHVWNWERAQDGVPVGLDPMRFALELALPGSRAAGRASADLGRASAVAIHRSGGSLRALGVPRQDEPLLMACLLAELLVRADARPRVGADSGPPTSEALLDELRRWVGRS
jgi:hypothetical protein